jgi:hypothetical protein
MSNQSDISLNLSHKKQDKDSKIGYWLQKNNAKTPLHKILGPGPACKIRETVSVFGNRGRAISHFHMFINCVTDYAFNTLIPSNYYNCINLKLCIAETTL